MPRFNGIDLDENTKGRDFLCADIHGKFDPLLNALSYVEFNEKDRLFMLGDLCDRGTQNQEALDFLNTHDNVYSVLGNHEQFCLHGYDIYENPQHDIINTHIYNGGGWWYDIDMQHPQKRKKYYDIMNSMYDFMTVKVNGKKIGLCHAEPLADWNDMYKDFVKHDYMDNANTVFWSRYYANELIHNIKPIENIDLVFCGHTPILYATEPKQKHNVYYCDNGFWYTDGEPMLINLSDFIV